MTQLRTSREVISLGNQDAIYLYHQRYGYILEMSADVHELWAAFGDGVERVFVEKKFSATLTGQSPSELIDIFVEFSCLTSGDEGDKWLDYVPVLGAWNTWERAGESVAIWTAWGERPPTEHVLSPAETAVWDAIDGEKRVSELGARFGAAMTNSLMSKLASIDIQAIKLSPVPVAVYGGRHRWPAYLTSTMPYPELGAESPATPELSAYHESIDDPDEQFDTVETTLAHLLRRPHIALGNRSYGHALLEALEGKGVVLGPEPLEILEIGGGLGELAASMLDAAEARGFKLNYQIVELSPSLASRQKKRAEGRAEVTVGDVNELELASASFDLIIANEMIGDLGVSDVVDAGALIERFGLDVDGAEPDAKLNSGAMTLVERASKWLAPGGLAVLTEFGERSQFARLSSHLDHPEYSIHFGHLLSVAKTLEIEAELVFLIDLLDMRRDLEGLATTRSQFRALKAMLGGRGVGLEKIGYTREMFTELVGANIAFGDLRFERIEDRLMGLVPHEFKALILRQA